MVKQLKKLWAWYDRLWAVPTVETDVVQRTYKAMAEARACDISIDRARYQRHMALSELQALENWNHQHNILESMPNAQYPTQAQ